ncbi:MAG: Gfo/Idh/MocA family oxidoreductase [Balneolaceae bacterium]
MSNKDKLSKKGISRRDFFKNASMAAGGGLLLGSLPVGASAYAAGQDKIKICVVGCGGRGSGAAAQALRAGEDVQLVAMADAFEDRLQNSFERLQNQFGDTDQMDVPEENRFVGFDAYRHAIDLADVVILATPPGFRPQHLRYAIEQNKHVFAEKPLATDVAGVKSVLETARMAEEKQLNVVVGLQRHYQNQYRELHNRTQYNSIGQIVSGQVYWNSGGVWVREREAGQSEMEYQMRNWYYFTWLCGDHILEQHIHNIDVANWFIGEYPETAQGMGGREVRKGQDHGEIFDHHFVEFTYPGGAVISSQCRHQPGTWGRVDETLQGTAGRVNMGSGRMETYSGRLIYQHNDDGDRNPYQVEHDELFAAVRNGEYRLNDTENGAMSTMTAILGRMATYSGQMITMEEALASDLKLVPDYLSWDVNPPVMPDSDGNYPVAIPGETSYT